MHPLERLANLHNLLLASNTPLTFEQIRERLPAYDQPDIESAKRMFERDKDALRDLGIPVEMSPTDAWAVEEGYIIPADLYYLPEIPFSEEELSALVVAGAGPAGDDEATLALRKILSGAGRELALAGSGASSPVAAGPAIAPSTLAVLDEAIENRHSVRFSYKTSKGVAGNRHVDPYSIVVRGSGAYLVGMDRDRGEIRSFRLSRLSSKITQTENEASPPPEGFVGRDHVSPAGWSGTAETNNDVTIRIAFSPEVVWLASAQWPVAQAGASREDGRVELEAAASSAIDDRLISWVLSFAADAEVLAPQDFRDAVRNRLEELLASL